MTPECCLLGADSENQRSVQIQRLDRRAPCGAQRNDAHTAPAKMYRPHIPARIEQRNFRFGDRVWSRPSRALTQRAGDASQRQIIGGGLPASRDGRDVIDVKSSFLSGLC